MPASKTPQQEDLRRDILESAIIGQEQARSAQQELERQGHRLRVSLDQTKRVAAETETAGKIVDRLISERRAGPVRTIFTCCFGCCFGSYCGKGGGEDDGSQKVTGEAKHQTASPIGTDDEDAEDAETIVHLDRLLKAQSKKKANTKASWQETLVPLPEVVMSSSNTGVDIWYRQVDACLSQLQQIAEDMGESLDEQIKLAQILAIYLDFGAEQAMRANEKLAIDVR